MISVSDGYLARAAAALAWLTVSPDLTASERAAMRGALGAVKGVQDVRAEKRSKARQKAWRGAPDRREAQLPTGDRT